MKKIIALILCIVSILSLSACSTDTSSLEGKITQLEEKIVELEEEVSRLENATPQESPKVEYEIIKLTKENYTQYLNINLEYSEYILSNVEGTNEYHLACKGRITTSSDDESYKFCDVTIFYNTQEVSAGWTSSVSPNVMLNRDGSSVTSFSLYKEQDSTAYLIFPSSYYYAVTIDSIFGNVLVPKEG